MKIDENTKYMDLNTNNWYYKVGKKSYLHENFGVVVKTRKPAKKEVNGGVGCSLKLAEPENIFNHESWNKDGEFIGRSSCLMHRDVTETNEMFKIVNKINALKKLFK